jgi:hypothetical protein
MTTKYRFRPADLEAVAGNKEPGFLLKDPFDII